MNAHRVYCYGYFIICIIVSSSVGIGCSAQEELSLENPKAYPQLEEALLRDLGEFDIRKVDTELAKAASYQHILDTVLVPRELEFRLDFVGG